jgi:hypothetical protein
LHSEFRHHNEAFINSIPNKRFLLIQEFSIKSSRDEDVTQKRFNIVFRIRDAQYSNEKNEIKQFSDEELEHNFAISTSSYPQRSPI